MLEKKIIHSVHGDFHLWQVVVQSHLIMSRDIYVYRDGRYHASYSSVKAAIDAANRKAGK